jgi:viroplasmin and RNaseH domain-containing protein
MDSASGEPFYVVRKGDVIGIYKNLADCQAQVSNSVNIFFSA